MEALVRLRYARILFEETDNTLEAETALSKGVCTLVSSQLGADTCRLTYVNE